MKTPSIFQYIKAVFKVAKKDVEREIRLKYQKNLINSLEDVIENPKSPYVIVNGNSESHRKKIITSTQKGVEIRGGFKSNGGYVPPGYEIETRGGYIYDIRKVE